MKVKIAPPIYIECAIFVLHISTKIFMICFQVLRAEVLKLYKYTFTYTYIFYIYFELLKLFFRKHFRKFILRFLFWLIFRMIFRPILLFFVYIKGVNFAHTYCIFQLLLEVHNLFSFNRSLISIEREQMMNFELKDS